MKKDKRQIYLVLATEVNTALCSFCRYIESDGGSICEEDSYSYCTHPIEVISDPENYISPEDDCWAFNPIVNVRDAADIVGVIIANGWTRWGYFRPPDRESHFEVYGVVNAKGT